MRLTGRRSGQRRAPDDLTFRLPCGESNKDWRRRPKTTYEIGTARGRANQCGGCGAHPFPVPDLACQSVLDIDPRRRPGRRRRQRQR